MGEIAEALRKANEPVDGSRGETNPASRSNDETAGEITAALSRASSAKSPPSSADPGDAARPEPTPAREMSHEGASAIPDHLAKIIFHVERHRHLGLRLRTLLDQSSAPSLAVVSALRNEGKTIVCCNIAAAIASVTNQRSVALVDLDLRNPSIARMLQIEVPVGIEQVIQGRAKLDEVRIALDNPEIDIYPCAQPHRSAHELLVLPALEAMIHQLHSRYSAVIIDTPPTLLVPDSTLIIRSAGHCIAIARSGQTRVRSFDEMLDRLPKEKVLGKVLNMVQLSGRERSDDYYYYGDGESQ